MKISWRLRLFSLLLVLVIALSIGWTVDRGFRALLDVQQEEALSLRVELEAKRLRSALQELENDVRLLATMPATREIISAAEFPGLPRDEAERRRHLAETFAEMMRAKPNYRQLRLIGLAERGREIVRVDRRPEGPRRAPDETLQEKGEREYFVEAMRQPDGEVYFSRVTLNREHGRLEIPHVPMLRCAMSVQESDGSPFGIVIVNLSFRSFLDDLFTADSNRYQVFVANESGDFVYHPDPLRTFGFELGERYGIQDEFTDWKPGESASRDGRIVRFHPLDIGGEDGARRLSIGLAASIQDIDDQAARIVERSMVLTGLLLLCALIVSYHFAAWLVRPLVAITSAAEKLARGERSPDLPLDRHDEIGHLARRFDHMVTELQANEARILEANRRLEKANLDLEHFAHVASHNLREPARRIAILADLALSKKVAGSSSGDGVLPRLRSISLGMLEQLTSFRVFAGLGAGELEVERFRLDEVFSEVVAEHAEEIQRRAILVTFARTPEVEANRDLVRVLLRNLVRNALDHVPGDGFLVELTAEEGTDATLFGVRNTGSHLPLDRCEDVFRAFVKLDRDRGGPGLGLSICRRIVDHHRGRIWAESAADQVRIQFTLRGKA